MYAWERFEAHPAGVVLNFQEPVELLLRDAVAGEPVRLSPQPLVGDPHTYASGSLSWPAVRQGGPPAVVSSVVGFPAAILFGPFHPVVAQPVACVSQRCPRPSAAQDAPRSLIK